MKPSASQSLKALRHADVPWDVNLVDPRAPRGVRHEHHGLLSTLLVALAVGKRTFRGAEELVEDVSPAVRRRLGLPKAVSDSTLYRLVEAQGTEGFRETLYNQYDEAWTAKVVQNDLFRLGVMSFDGKGTWSSTEVEVEGAKESSYDAKGSPLWQLGTLRAVHTSSKARPCVDVEMIGAKEAEPAAFREMFPRVCQQFGRRFQVVTGDAGLACRQNAHLVQEAKRDYVFNVKGNQPHLFALAQSLLSAAPCEQRTDERVNGKRIIRELSRVCFELGEEPTDFPGARQLWLVRQTTYAEGKAPAVEDRYFVTSLTWLALNALEALALVRLHWGIENGHNWTMDVILGEDDSQPCQQSKESIEVVTWLRVLAYNLVSAWRAKAKLKDKRPMPWKRVMEKLRDSLVHPVSWGALPTSV